MRKGGHLMRNRGHLMRNVIASEYRYFFYLDQLVHLNRFSRWYIISPLEVVHSNRAKPTLTNLYDIFQC